MRKVIPAPLISVVAEAIANIETHATMDKLFLYSDAPGDPPEGSKYSKGMEWLRRINKESEYPLQIFGKLIESYMEDPDRDSPVKQDTFGPEYKNPMYEPIQKITKMLSQYGLQYHLGGIISDGTSAPTKTLSEIIKGRNLPAIHTEFDRAISNVASDPREAVLASCNILESVFKTYIEDEGLTMPAKQDLQGVWKVVRDDLGFDTSKVQDQDLRKILSGLFSTIDGIGALRTHASASHGEGRIRYNLKPRHARLAIHSAHTLASFIIESWDERKANN